MKSEIIEQLGQADLLLPALIAEGLTANDRVKLRLGVCKRPPVTPANRAALASIWRANATLRGLTTSRWKPWSIAQSCPRASRFQRRDWAH
jgi:hypothetical protein